MYRNYLMDVTRPHIKNHLPSEASVSNPPSQQLSPMVSLSI